MIKTSEITGVWCNDVDLIKWQPKQGEWCWIFGQTPYNVPTIGKFKHRGKDTFYFEASNGQLYHSTSCEPFIGQLPSTFKDSHDC